MSNKPTAFGLSMGMKETELDIAEVMDGGFCVLNSVPNPHTKFTNYYGVVSDNYGLTKIMAVNSEITTNSYGNEIMFEFENLAEKLVKKYGGGELFDYLMEDSIWHEPTDWMSSLIQKERVLHHSWERSAIYDIDSNLESVTLIASAEDSNTGSLALHYDFTTYALHQKELEELEDEFL